LVVLTACEFDNHSTIAIPTRTPVVNAPAKYPSISRFGLGKNNITVVAVSRVGLSAAVSANRKPYPPRITTCPAKSLNDDADFCKLTRGSVADLASRTLSYRADPGGLGESFWAPARGSSR
jgi:hypothetical protein